MNRRAFIAAAIAPLVAKTTPAPAKNPCRSIEILNAGTGIVVTRTMRIHNIVVDKNTFQATLFIQPYIEPIFIPVKGGTKF